MDDNKETKETRTMAEKAIDRFAEMMVARLEEMKG